MHDNANITCAITEADATFGIILTLQPRIAAGGWVNTAYLKYYYSMVLIVYVRMYVYI